MCEEADERKLANSHVKCVCIGKTIEEHVMIATPDACENSKCVETHPKDAETCTEESAKWCGWMLAEEEDKWEEAYEEEAYLNEAGPCSLRIMNLTHMCIMITHHSSPTVSSRRTDYGIEHGRFFATHLVFGRKGVHGGCARGAWSAAC